MCEWSLVSGKKLFRKKDNLLRNLMSIKLFRDILGFKTRIRLLEKNAIEITLLL